MIKQLNSLKRTSLKGSITLLTPVGPDDLSLIVKWRNEPFIRKAFLSDTVFSMPKQRRWYRNYLKKDDEVLFIISEEGGTRIGTLSLYNIDTRNGNCEIGRLCIGDRRFSGRGYMRDALWGLISHAFKKLGMYRVYLEVIADNNKAAALYRSLGFKLEGVERGRLLRGGKRLDVLLMSVIRGELRK